jgi:uncharacterized membrane protein
MALLNTPRTCCSANSTDASLTREHAANHAPAGRALAACVVVVCVLAACSSPDPAADTPRDTIAPAPVQQDSPADPPPATGDDAGNTYFEGSEHVWLEARERGVTFRAVGQEPGWLLEIEGERRIRVAVDYGQDERFTPVPRPVVDSTTWTTTYRAVTEGTDLRVSIRDEPCADTMSGERFSATVVMVLDGTTYHGCGRSLDELP